MLSWLKNIIPRSRNFLFFSRGNQTISGLEPSLDLINKKIYTRSKSDDKKTKSLSFSSYEEYFTELKKLGLWTDFELVTSKDGIKLRGTVLNPLVINENCTKTIIFCHGVTNNRWVLFYCTHLVLQMGYQAVIYDARNHGGSDRSYTTLGKVEASDLEDVLKWVEKNQRPSKIGLYGFSMGAATLLFWLGQFQDLHSKVSFVICDSPFDDFRKRFLDFLNIEEAHLERRLQWWKNHFSSGLLTRLLSSPIDISKIKPIQALPAELKVKVLLFHGTEDKIIPWKASLRIWEKLSENAVNKKMVSFYLFEGADHGEVSFLGDFIPESLRWIKNMEKNSQFCFTSLLYSFLRKYL